MVEVSRAFVELPTDYHILNFFTPVTSAMAQETVDIGKIMEEAAEILAKPDDEEIVLNFHVPQIDIIMRPIYEYDFRGTSALKESVGFRVKMDRATKFAVSLMNPSQESLERMKDSN